ncbi:hypothetical protein HYPSUDRAFT_235076 [Hypholoma sublateritium FD-334 SS-4]|uniref:Uncharacterized protein n=1 Tax=Hypholoma sublateritium (strain FD-334 SS-4) TaxID=945553 RepID=A0A0D2N054_HYPSF|nr:hypothetical protein HYPSUDRAFT_235076 [Hypholoma sublateritium FD-334 SS-4]
MSSTLDACFQTAEATATKDLETREKEVSQEESELSEQRDRLEAERALDFFEELGSSAVETEALKLAMRSEANPEDEEPLKPYNDMLHTLEELRNEATSLQDSITKLTESPPSDDASKPASGDASEAHSQVSNIFASCLPVIRARIANLSLAQDLIDTALENISLSLRMESMGLA